MTVHNVVAYFVEFVSLTAFFKYKIAGVIKFFFDYRLLYDLCYRFFQHQRSTHLTDLCTSYCIYLYCENIFNIPFNDNNS